MESLLTSCVEQACVGLWPRTGAQPTVGVHRPLSLDGGPNPEEIPDGKPTGLKTPWVNGGPSGETGAKHSESLRLERGFKAHPFIRAPKKVKPGGVRQSSALARIHATPGFSAFPGRPGGRGLGSLPDGRRRFVPAARSRAPGESHKATRRMKSQKQNKGKRKQSDSLLP